MIVSLFEGPQSVRMDKVGATGGLPMGERTPC